MGTTLSHIEFTLSEMRSRYQQAQGQLTLLQAQANETETRLLEVQDNLDVWKQVQVLFGKVSEFARQQLKTRVEQTVTAALQAVFGEEGLAFEIEMGERAGQPAAEWKVVSLYGDQVVMNNPEDARGGGIVDIVSLALRLALLELTRPKPGGPVILDEPGKMVSAEYAPNLAVFLKEYCRRTGRACLMVTHNDALAQVADKSFRVAKVNGESVVSVA